MHISVVVPTINSIDSIKKCIASLKKQSLKCDIIVVANGSTDGTQRYLSHEHPDVEVLSYLKPLGFAGAVNAGIRHSIQQGSDFVALLNNDAEADRKWLENLYETIRTDDAIGIVTGKIVRKDSNKFDSTGDYYTTWLLPYPRGRGVRDRGQFDRIEEVVSASGGASIYRIKMLQEIGLFDEEFFAYYEDVDISLRAHHAGWKVMYNFEAVVWHEIGGTSSKIKGFTTLQTIKNLPLLYLKNVPFRLLVIYIHKFNIAYLLFVARAFTRGHGYYAIKGYLLMLLFFPKKLIERWKILGASKLSASEFDSLLVHDLPPNAKALRKIKSFFRK